MVALYQDLMLVSTKSNIADWLWWLERPDVSCTVNLTVVTGRVTTDLGNALDFVE